MVSVNKKNILFLLGLLFFLVIIRLGIILTSVEIISHYDELDLGTIARDLSRGLYVPFWYYQLDAYSGEALILGPLVLPFAKLFGQNIFAIKMVTFGCSILTLCAIFGFTLRYFGEKAARYAGLLFVLAPPGLVQLSLCTMTGHTEAFFAGFLSLFLFYEFFYRGQKKKFLFLWGISAGLAVWFYYANAMMVASCLLIFFIADRRFFLRSLPFFAAVFLAAFSPWFISNFRNHFIGLELVSENLSGFGMDRLLYVLKKPVKLILLDLPLSLATLRIYFIPRNAFAYAYYACLIAAVFPFLARPVTEVLNKKINLGPVMIFWVYPLVYLFVLTASRFDFDREIGFVGYRYATPLIFILLLSAAVCCSLSVRRTPIFALLLVLGLVGQSGLLFKEPFARAFSYIGYSYFQLGTRWHFNLSNTFLNYHDFQNQTKDFPLRERRLILWGLTDMAKWNSQELLFLSRQGVTKDITAQAMVHNETREYDPFSYAWIGGFEKFAPPEGIPLLESVIQTVPETSRKYFCQGWLSQPVQAENFVKCPDCYAGKNICDILTEDKAFIDIQAISAEEGQPKMKEIESFKPEERKRAYRGIGYSLFLFDLVLNPLNKVPLPLKLAKISKENMPDVYWGVGWAIREKFREDRARAFDWIDRLPGDGKDFARKGLEGFDKWYYPE